MNRAQAHTLEAFVAALILVAGLIFAAQATAVTPLSASTSNQHIENQHRALAQDLLSTTAEDGSLHAAVVYWEDEENGFIGTHDNRTYYTETPTENTETMTQEAYENHSLTPTLENLLDSNHLAYNIDLVYRDDDNGTDETRMVEMGSPSDNAVAATRSVVLYDSTEISGGTNEGTTLGELEPGEFYAPNVDQDGQLYNVVEVRIVVWRL